jgi:outer membrane protein assembly factor BamB
MSTFSGVEVNDGTLFSSDERDFVWSLDKKNGATLWKQDKLKARQLTRPVAMKDWIVVGDYEGYLHWLSQYDGHFVARERVAGSGILVPPLVSNDRLYVLSREGELTAYELDMN